MKPELDLAPPPADQIDPVSGLDWRRMMIPAEYVLQFKRVLGKGIEVHAVLGPRILVSEIEPYSALDETNRRLAAETGKVIHQPDVHWKDDRRVVAQKPPACTGFVIAIGDKIENPLVREGGAVAFGQYSGNQFSIGTVGFRVLEASEILFVLRTIEGETMDSVHVPVRVDVVEGFQGA